MISPLHLTRTLARGSKPFQPTDAGIAFAAVVFAILGFIVGLDFTIRSGEAVDVDYHATVLPLLLVTLVALAGRGVGSLR